MQQPPSKSRSSLCSALSLSPCHCASPFPLLTLLCSCCNNAPTFMARNAAGSWQTNALRLSWHATASSRHGRHPPEAEHSKSVSPADISNVCKHISSAQLLLPSRCCAATAGSAFISTFAIFQSILFCAGFKSRWLRLTSTSTWQNSHYTLLMTQLDYFAFNIYNSGGSCKAFLDFKTGSFDVPSSALMLELLLLR